VRSDRIPGFVTYTRDTARGLGARSRHLVDRVTMNPFGSDVQILQPCSYGERPHSVSSRRASPHYCCSDSVAGMIPTLAMQDENTQRPMGDTG